MSPRKRTSPWRPASARATEIFLLEVSRPTKTALSCCMARPLCVRLGARPSGATLVRRIARDEPPPLQKRTYGLPGEHLKYLLGVVLICAHAAAQLVQVFPDPVRIGAGGGTKGCHVMLHPENDFARSRPAAKGSAL